MENNLIIIDTCEGNLMHQTCIIRHEHPYYIIMSPMTDEFESQQADMNVMHMEEKELRLIRNAIASGRSVVRIGNTIIPLASFNPRSLQNSHNLLFYNRQKTINGLVIKLVRHDIGKVYYVVS